MGFASLLYISTFGKTKSTSGCDLYPTKATIWSIAFSDYLVDKASKVSIRWVGVEKIE